MHLFIEHTQHTQPWIRVIVPVGWMEIILHEFIGEIDTDHTDFIRVQDTYATINRRNDSEPVKKTNRHEASATSKWQNVNKTSSIEHFRKIRKRLCCHFDHYIAFCRSNNCWIIVHWTTNPKPGSAHTHTQAHASTETGVLHKGNITYGFSSHDETLQSTCTECVSSIGWGHNGSAYGEYFAKNRIDRNGMAQIGEEVSVRRRPSTYIMLLLCAHQLQHIYDIILVRIYGIIIIV